MRRHPSEGIFGVQLAGNKPATLVPTAETIARECGPNIDFVDLNCGCPIDLVFKSGSGSAREFHNVTQYFIRVSWLPSSELRGSEWRAIPPSGFRLRYLFLLVSQSIARLPSLSDAKRYPLVQFWMRLESWARSFLG